MTRRWNRRDGRPDLSPARTTAGPLLLPRRAPRRTHRRPRHLPGQCRTQPRSAGHGQPGHRRRGRGYGDRRHGHHPRRPRRRRRNHRSRAAVPAGADRRGSRVQRPAAPARPSAQAAGEGVRHPPDRRPRLPRRLGHDHGARGAHRRSDRGGERCARLRRRAHRHGSARPDPARHHGRRRPRRRPLRDAGELAYPGTHPGVPGSAGPGLLRGGAGHLRGAHDPRLRRHGAGGGRSGRRCGGRISPRGPDRADQRPAVAGERPRYPGGVPRGARRRRLPRRLGHPVGGGSRHLHPLPVHDAHAAGHRVRGGHHRADRARRSLPHRGGARSPFRERRRCPSVAVGGQNRAASLCQSGRVRPRLVRLPGRKARSPRGELRSPPRFDDCPRRAVRGGEVDGPGAHRALL